MPGRCSWSRDVDTCLCTVCTAIECFKSSQEVVLRLRHYVLLVFFVRSVRDKNIACLEARAPCGILRVECAATFVYPEHILVRKLQNHTNSTRSLSISSTTRSNKRAMSTDPSSTSSTPAITVLYFAAASTETGLTSERVPLPAPDPTSCAYRIHRTVSRPLPRCAADPGISMARGLAAQRTGGRSHSTAPRDAPW